ncbi:MAG: pantoate--beta-alanine ligase [Segetibacter sp.]|nr:pantoate--beta-alanine ligase [Segetibacter sp.]
MILFKEAATLAKYIKQLKQEGQVIGFAPTMGALHSGHISLIEKSKSICDKTVSSIFVNPTQFNDSKDFEKYPVTIGNDILLLENAGCDILFLPSVTEIYPNGTSIRNRYDLGETEFLLEGKFRPGHFQGVCQVVHRLLDIVQPHNLFMGQKDYQQCIVVKRLVQLMNLPVKVITAGTYREPTGLAMSSRNLRLNDRQKQEAAGISKMLDYIKENYPTAPFSALENHAVDYLLKSGFSKVDYVSIADAETLQEAVTITKGRKLVALIAAFIGDVRLIDNIVLQD